ncbi:hypothetical protein BC941DRAFT_388418 [Chlamydoabsidia padenii]|nr:hypothetical protein BC941DRAFT_388418 [Chlamydoabsidia padenii]
MTTTRNERPPPTLISYPIDILTLQDVILDSPAFRSNIEQVAEQADLFEKWLEGFVRVLKHYIDSLSKTNAQTSQLCKQLVPNKNDYSFICNSQVAAMVINTFTGALQSNLNAKIKLVNDLDETLLQPMQSLLKTDLKEFKEMRRTFEKTLDKYENHLSRYSILSKQKEPSALREDAFQLFDIQKSYTRASGTYFIQLITLKSKVEHLLVDCFSGGLTDHIDHLDQSLHSQSSTRTMIPGWRQWLDESKTTCTTQLARIQESTQALEDIYIRQIRPHRSLKRYSTCNNDKLVAITNSSTIDLVSDEGNDLVESPDQNPKMGSSTSLPTSASYEDIHATHLVRSSSTSSSNSNNSLTSQSSRHVKQGYLFSRIVVGKPSRYSWVRRWFFLKDGWFGQYIVSTVNKVKGTMTICDRIPINSSCECRIFTDIDRRFCFEVIGAGKSFFLQSETEQEMQQWLWTIERAKEHMVTTGDETNIPHALLSPKATMSIRKPTNDPSQVLVSLSALPPAIPSPTTLSKSKPNLVASDYLANDLSITSVLTTLMIRESVQTDTSSETFDTANDDNLPDIQSTHSASGDESNQGNQYKKDQEQGDDEQDHDQEPSARRHASTSTSTSWSMPWLMSGINAFSSTSIDSDSNSNQEPQTIVVWPNKVESDAPKVTLENYSEDLVAGQRELRRYFACVPTDELVLDVFSASLYRQPKNNTTKNGGDMDSTRDTSNQNITDHGNGFSGTVYMTQKSLWFYSCRMMTCVNAAVIPFSSIKAIRLEKVLSGNSQGMLLYIDTKATSSSTYCFGLWLDYAELIAERLRVVTENAKRTEKMDNQVLFDIIRCTTIGKIRSKTPTSQVIATSTSNAAVSPITVQAQSRTTAEPQAVHEHLTRSKPATPSPPSSLSDSGGPSAGKLYMERQQHNASPAAGALTAAMEAADEAQTKSRQGKTSNASKTEEEDIEDDNKSNTGEALEPPPATAPVNCNCEDHLEKTEADLELPISAQSLFNILTGTSCWELLNKKKGNSVPSASKWQQGETGSVERTLKYTMPNPMVKGTADVIETQQILKKQDELCYVIMITTSTPTLPYSDAFIPMIKLCITYNAPNTCRLVCNIGVNWLKNVMIKGMVNRAALKGMCETISALTPILEQEATAKLGKEGPTKQKRQVKVETNKEEVSTSQQITDSTSSPKQSEQQQDHSKTIRLGGVVFGVRWIALLGVITLLFMVYPTWWLERLRSGSAYQGTISWRAVYLTDLDSLVNGNDLVIHNSSAYQRFKSLRSDMGGWEYNWFNIRHRLSAAELAFTREQLAVVRFELLAAFKTLNGMERRLTESEYRNWLLDQQQRCDTLGSENNNTLLCSDITAELEHI